MPFDRNAPIETSGTVGIGHLDQPEPAFLDTLSAAYRQENIIGSYLSSARRGVDDFDSVEADFNPFDDIKGYEPFADRFENVYNRKAHQAVKADIDKELKDRQTLQASGWTGAGLSMVASVTDPTLLLPGGALWRVGRIGYGALRSGLSVGTAAAVGTAVQEGFLQSTQETRTGAESALAIGGSAILGGLIGAGAATFLSKGEWDRVSKTLAEELADDVPDPDTVTQEIVRRMQSAGAAAVDDIKLDDLGIGGPRAAQLVARATAAARINPGIETMFSPSVKVRETYAKLVDNAVYTSMNMDGRSLGADVENLVKVTERGPLSQWLREVRAEWKAAKQDGWEGTRREFHEAIAKAGRRGDTDANPHVTKMAQSARAKIFDPLLERAKELGLLPDDVKVTTAASYVTRLWNRQMLIGQEGEFRRIARQWLTGELRKAELRADDIKLGNRIVDSDRLRETYDRAFSRLDGLERRVNDRQGIRERKTDDLTRLRQDRFDVMRERAPASLVAALRGADETSIAIDAVKEARKAERAKQPSYAERYPVLATIREKGGVRLGSVLDRNLRSMGVTPKTHPGLFKKGKGLGDMDNFVAEDEEFFTGLPVDDNGYVELNALYDAISNELAGRPLRTAAQDAADAAVENADRFASEWLESVGLPADAKVKDVRDFMARVLGTERNLDAVDMRISRLESELEDFDKATDAVKNERDISASEAKVIADQLEELEAGIAEAAQQANSSPAVKLVVDYATAKRDLFKGKLEARRLDARIEAIERINADGRANAEMLAELAAKRVDLKRVEQKIAKATDKADKLAPMVPKIKREMPDFVSDADRNDYIEDIITSIFNNLTGRGKGDMPEWIVPATRGPLKERTFNIPDEMVEDFLENDMELVLRRYSRVMGAEVELTQKFGRADMKDQIEAINKDYDDLAAAAKTEKERMRLNDARKRDVTNIEAFRDMVRGTYKAADENSAWSKITRAALTWNYIRLLGGVVLSSVSDTARLVGVHGVRATMREALPSLVSNIKAVQISKRDARDLGVVAEMVLQSRLASLADLQDPYRLGSKYERFLSNTSNLFTKATGLSWWNDTMKSMASVMTQNRMARNALDWKSAGPREQAYMAYLGINEDMAGRIAAELKAHGEQSNRIWGANLSNWTDDAARRAWGAALAKDVDRTIITKGVADTPLWTKTNWGRLIMQFKSFGLASHQRVLIAGLQERPHRLAEMMVMGTTVGMMAGWLKYVERGDMDEAARLVANPGLWIADGLDRTGILSLPFEISNTAQKIGSPFGIVPLAQAIAGDEDQGGQASRYASRNKLGAVLGPSAGIFEDLTAIAQQLAEGDLKKSGANAAIRQLPFSTLPGVRTAIHIGIKPALHGAVE